MPDVRLIYFSENQIDPTAGSTIRVLNRILSVSSTNNSRSNITGALVFDDQWFVQVLEGERAQVWSTFERIREDERHSDVVIAEVVDIRQRMFANWWMGVATRTEKTATIFAPYLRNGRMDPRKLSASELLSLVKAMAQVGLQRELVEREPVVGLPAGGG